MAVSDLSAAPSQPAHPMAKPGFGKRSASDGGPEARTDFAHLPEREAYLAAYIDRLPEGAAIDVKTLAKSQPLYGQLAVRSALRKLTTAGHLRRIGGHSGGPVLQHVTRTYFSRVPREERWWCAYLDVPPAPAHAPAEPQPTPEPAAARPRSAQRPRSEAYEALAVLGQRDARLVLSAADCARLEPLATQWHERGVRGEQFTCALTSGLPPTVHNPAALLRRRLTDKLPPEPAAPPPPAEPEVRRWRLECTDCGIPGEPQAFTDGLCRRCRNEPDPDPVGGLTPEQVGAWSQKLRGTLRRPTAARPAARRRDPRRRRETA